MSLNSHACSVKQVFQDATVEMGVEKRMGRDEAELARHGKKQQLRVLAVPLFLLFDLEAWELT